jgi:hypothetical protein
MAKGRHRAPTRADRLGGLAVIALGAVMAVLSLYAVPTPPADATPTASTAAGCAKPKKVATKMDYGSGILGPLGTYVKDGDMATADVGIFGDSITIRGCGELKAWLAANGGHTLATDAQASRPITKTATDIESYAALPPVVIVAAGTNDIFNPTVFGAQMDRILAYLATHAEVQHVLWIDVQACRVNQVAAVKLADQRNSMAINMQIHERLPANQIVPWAWSFISNPVRLAEYLEDGVHPYVGPQPAGSGHSDGTANWRAWIWTKLAALL